MEGKKEAKGTMKKKEEKKKKTQAAGVYDARMGKYGHAHAVFFFFFFLSSFLFFFIVLFYHTLKNCPSQRTKQAEAFFLCRENNTKTATFVRQGPVLSYMYATSTVPSVVCEESRTNGPGANPVRALADSSSSRSELQARKKKKYSSQCPQAANTSTLAPSGTGIGLKISHGSYLIQR